MLSPEADDLARRVMALLTTSERDSFGRTMDNLTSGSAKWAEWMADPQTYLADLDAQCVARISDWLTGEYERLRKRAIGRGWEVAE